MGNLYQSFIMEYRLATNLVQAHDFVEGNTNNNINNDNTNDAPYQNRSIYNIKIEIKIVSLSIINFFGYSSTSFSFSPVIIVPFPQE